MASKSKSNYLFKAMVWGFFACLIFGLTSTIAVFPIPNPLQDEQVNEYARFLFKGQMMWALLGVIIGIFVFLLSKFSLLFRLVICSLGGLLIGRYYQLVEPPNFVSIRSLGMQLFIPVIFAFLATIVTNYYGRPKGHV